jgi:hypothetical protein
MMLEILVRIARRFTTSWNADANGGWISSVIRVGTLSRAECARLPALIPGWRLVDGRIPTVCQEVPDYAQMVALADYSVWRSQGID